MLNGIVFKLTVQGKVKYQFKISCCTAILFQPVLVAIQINITLHCKYCPVDKSMQTTSSLYCHYTVILLLKSHKNKLCKKRFNLIMSAGQQIPTPKIPKAVPAPNNVYMEGGIDAMSCVSLEASPVRYAMWYLLSMAEGYRTIIIFNLIKRKISRNCFHTSHN